MRSSFLCAVTGFFLQIQVGSHHSLNYIVLFTVHTFVQCFSVVLITLKELVLVLAISSEFH